MAISDTLPPTAGVGNGILIPKLIHQFRVGFTEEYDLERSIALDLTRQIVSVGDFILETTNHVISFVFEDDQTNAALKALRVLQGAKEFNMVVDILNGNETILERRCFTGCRVDNVYFSELNYNPHNKGNRFVLDIPSKMSDKSVSSFLAVRPEFEALMLALSGASVTLIDYHNETANSVLHHTVDIAYSSMKQTLYPE